jgi:hypothetical protein
MGRISSKDGVILIPDNFQTPNGIDFTSGINKAFATNQYNSTQWRKMEVAGAVFLPLAGYRSGSSISNPSYGYYWTSTMDGTTKAKTFQFYAYSAGFVSSSLYIGQCIRLVRDAN